MSPTDPQRIRAAALKAYHVIDELVASYNDPDDGPPPAELLDAHAALFEALDMDNVPSIDPGDELPF